MLFIRDPIRNLKLRIDWVLSEFRNGLRLLIKYVLYMLPILRVWELFQLSLLCRNLRHFWGNMSALAHLYQFSKILGIYFGIYSIPSIYQIPEAGSVDCKLCRRTQAEVITSRQASTQSTPFSLNALDETRRERPIPWVQSEWERESEREREMSWETTDMTFVLQWKRKGNDLGAVMGHSMGYAVSLVE